MRKNKIPLISIITISYNVVDLIEATIFSVINQSVRNNIEYIIVDGASIDGTLDVINKYASKIDIILSEKDNGISDAFNKGIKLSSGKYILLLNSGDVFNNNNVVEDVIQFINQNENIDIIYGEAICMLNRTPMFKIKALPQNEFILIHPFMCHQAMFCKKYLFNSYGYFDVNLKFAMDYDWYLKCILQGVKISAINSIVVNYSLGGTSDNHIIDALTECKNVAIKYGFNSDKVNIFYRKKIIKAKIQNILNILKVGWIVIRFKSIFKKQYEFIN